MTRPGDPPGQSGGAARVRRRFAGTPADLRHARRFVVEHVPHRVAADAELLVSELASNAVLHARTTFEVEVAPCPIGVRVEVADSDPTVPRRGRHDALAVSGRGLQIVDHVATDWGVERVPHGKRIWFELSC